MAKGLTEKQRKILEFIIDFQKDHGFPPTIRELGDAFQIGSLRGVTVHLDALVRKGYLTRERTSRSLRVISADPRDVTVSGRGGVGGVNGVGGGVGSASGKQDNGVRLPLVSTLGVGGGEFLADKIAAEGQVERHLAIPEEIAYPATENGFVIRVGASGVKDEPLLPGDLLVVRPQRMAAAGDLVVTFSHGDMVVSRTQKAIAAAAVGAGVADALDADGISGDGEVLGRVVGLIRRY